MGVRIDKARKNGFMRKVYNGGISGDRNISADIFDFISFDKNHRVFNRLVGPAVDELSAFNRGQLLRKMRQWRWQPQKELSAIIFYVRLHNY